MQFAINDQPGPRVASSQLTIDVAPPLRTTTRDRAGNDSIDYVGGSSAKALVQLIGVPAQVVRELGVKRYGSGDWVTISGEEVSLGFSGDPQGLREATFNPFNGPVNFFRPLRGPSDVNGPDVIAADTRAGDLQVRLTTDGQLLNVIAFGAAKTDAGQPQSFSAQLASDLPAGQTPSWFWDFGDGTTGRDQRTTHAFAADGTYDVVATVTTPDGSAGVSQPVRVTVGQPKTGGETTSPAPSTNDLSGTGGAGSGGGSAPTGAGNAGPQAATGGAAQGDGAGRTPTKDRQPTRGRTDPTGDRPARPTQKAPAPPAPATSDRATEPLAPRDQKDGTAQQRQRPERAQQQPSTSQPVGGEAVQGTLVGLRSVPAAELAAIAGDIAAPLSAEPAAARAAAGGAGDVAGWLGGLAVLAGLLGAGVLREGVRASRPQETP